MDVMRYPSAEAD